jgi:hypothetical protein
MKKWKIKVRNCERKKSLTGQITENEKLKGK